MIQEVIGSGHSPAWIALAGVAMGSFFGFGGNWLNNKANEKRQKEQHLYESSLQKRDRTREKLEQLFLMVGGWSNGMGSLHYGLSKTMLGELTYDQHIEIMSNSSDEQPDFCNLEMLIQIYGRDLLGQFQGAMKARDAWNRIGSKFVRAYKAGHMDGRSYYESYTQAFKDVHGKCKTLKESVAQLAAEVHASNGSS